MPLQWDSQLSTGLNDVDDQHMQLVLLINNLEEAINAHKGSSIISETIEELNSYVYNHFMTEEKIMRDHDYPHMAKHINEHNYFKKKMIRFNFRPDCVECDPFNILSFLKQWFINHICTADKELGSFVRTAS